MPIHVLLIEDNPGDARLIVEMLKEADEKAFSVECAESLATAFDKLSKQVADVVLLDLSLPDSHGLDTFFRFQSEHPKLPTVILTGLDDEEAAVRAARAGAQDYFLKGTISETSLARALKYAVERKKAEEKYRTLFDSMDEGFCTIQVIFNEENKAVDYRFLEVNPAFEKQTGIRDALGKTMREIASQHEESWFEIYGKIALTGEPCRFEHEAAELNRWFDVYASRIGEPQERKVAILFNNVTARKQAEETLRRSEAKLREAQRVARLGSWTMDVSTGQVTWSEELYGMLGVDSTLPAVPFSEQERLFTPESWERLTTAVDEALHTGVPYELELETVRSDGSKQWMLTRGEPVCGPDGAVTGLQGITLDISERKLAEESQRRIEASVSALVESTDDLIWSVDLDYRLRTFNRALEKVIEQQHGTEVAVGKRSDELLPPDVAAAWVEMYQRAVSEGRFRLEYSTTYGHFLDVALNLIVENGQKTGVSVFAKDITDRKRSEAARQESETNFKTLSDFVPQMVWMCTPDGSNVYFNQRWVDYTGMSLDESYGTGWNTPFHDDDKQAAWDAWTHAIATGTLTV